MKKLSILFIVFLFLPLNLLAQAPETLWTKTFGGSGNNYGIFVRETTDNGYIIIGSSLIKTNSEGIEMWSKNIAGSCVQQTSDGGYILTGNDYGNEDLLLVKTNSLGETIWTKSYGDSAADIGRYVRQTTDGGYIITGQKDGYLGGYIWLIKTDSSGDSVWTKTYGDSLYNSGYCVQQTSDGGFILSGTHNCSGLGTRYAIIIKTDTKGDTLWTKTFPHLYDCEFPTIQQTTDGGYIVAGWTNSTSVPGDVLLIKMNASGNTLWTKTFGDSGYYTVGHSVQQTTDGGYIICGLTELWGTQNSDVWLLKTDDSGDSLWVKTFGGSDEDGGNSIQQTTDGGYIICGSTRSFGAGEGDIWLIRLTSELTSVDNKSNIPTRYLLQQNYPNPFNPSTTINYLIPQRSNVTLKIYDILGKEVTTLVNEEKSAGNYERTWNTTNLPSGVYFYRLQAGSFVETKKMVLMK